MKEILTDIHKEIVERCKQNDRNAQYELYQLYSKAMFNICVRMLNSVEEAEDQLQEVFVEVFNRLKSFRYESTVGAWIKRITVNKCINALRKRKVELVFINDETTIDYKEENDENIPEFNVSNVKEAMKVLADGSRSIFSLYLLEGYDHKEISEILNITVSTSKTQYMRAKMKVKAELREKNNLFN